MTGGAGFLGRGIMRRAAEEGWDARFLVYSRDPQKHTYAQQRYGNSRYVIGDILDSARMLSYMSFCDYVIHAAALKHLPECEAQPSQAIRINVDGTRSLMEAANAARIQRVVCISTDKAAAPLNTYGMTKALVERLVFETVQQPAPFDTTYVGCRYGNVIGSTGSIWPVFKQQRVKQNYLSVTDPNMTRFFVSIDEAVDVVLAAFTAPAGTIVIPQPETLRIGDLADHLTKLWCLEPPIIVGLRPGEKNHETMLAMSEESQLEAFGKFYCLSGPTTRAAHPATMRGATSDTADTLTPEEFVDAAQLSERV